MSQASPHPVVRHLRSLASASAGPSDPELLQRFLSRCDEGAFEALLRRHGPMVLRVARRVLGSEPDAEDVFQATFLLLARKAGSVRKGASLASWLHGAAHRLALHARADAARRRAKERRAAAARPEQSPTSPAWGELEGVLDDALAALPERYRGPLVSCYLEGRTQEEVARLLGAPLGTVRSRIARGREMLRKRLARRGVALSTGATGTALLACAAGAAACPVPGPLTQTTLALAAGGTALAEVTPRVTELLRVGVASMGLAKLKAAAVVCVLGLAVIGAAWAARPGSAVPSPTEAVSDERDSDKTEMAKVDRDGDALPPGAVARLGTVRFRQSDLAGQFAVSPDGRTLAAVADNALTVWDAEGRPLRRINSDARLHSFTFTPDGKSVALGDENWVVTLFDLATGKETRKFVSPLDEKKDPFSRGIWGIAFAPDGETFITWGSDKVVRTWGVRSGKELRQLPVKDQSVEGVSPDGKILAVTAKGADKTLLLLEPETGKEVRRLNHADAIGRVAFSADGKTLAVATGATETPGKIVLWDRESGKEIGMLSGHEAGVFALAFSPDGKTLASGGYDHTLRLWDLGSRKPRGEARRTVTPVYQLGFSRDGKTLFSRGFENHVRLWDAASGRERPPADGPHSAIASVAYSPDGRLVTAASWNVVWVWEAATGKVVRKFEDHPGNVSAAAFAPDGKSVLASGLDGTVYFWDLASGKESRRVPGLKGRVQLTALSPDGTTLAGWGHDNVLVIGLWDVRTGKEIRTLDVTPETPGVRGFLHALRFSADGKTLHAASGNHLALLRWDVATGAGPLLLGKHDGGVNDVALSPDGRSLASVSMGSTLYLWEAATGQARLAVKDAGYATSVVFSPDGRFLALANNGTHSLHGGGGVRREIEQREEVRLVSTADGKVIHRFAGHFGGVGCLSFAPGGKTLASGGRDTTVLLWDVAGQVTPAAAASLKDKDLQTAWSALRGDVGEAYHAVVTLSSAPAQTVRFLGGQVKPVKPLASADAERISTLVKALDGEQFAEREDATRALKKLGDGAEPALRKVLEGTLSPEIRRRVKEVLDAMSGAAGSPERTRTLRAVEVLERVGNRDARDLLRRLADGAPGAWLTEEAKTTLRRLEGKARP